jgi:hypothetical protein
MEIRLIINGNLVQTMMLPKLALVCSKVTLIYSLYVETIPWYLLLIRLWLPVCRESLQNPFKVLTLIDGYNIEWSLYLTTGIKKKL